MKVLGSNLIKLYGTSTRSVRVFNTFIHSVWFILLTLHSSSVKFQIDIPDKVLLSIDSIKTLALATVFLSLLSFTLTNRKRILTKFVSLLLGAMVQCIIAIKYSSTYPPLLDVMTVVSSLIALWLVGGAFYVKTTDSLEVQDGSRT